MSEQTRVAAQLREWIPSCGAEVPMAMEDDLRQAIAALEAADELARFVWEDCAAIETPNTVKDAYHAYRSTRADSRTTTEGSDNR